MSLVFSKSRQPQIIMTVFCQGLQSLACLLACVVSLWLFWLSPRICLGQFKAEKTCSSIPPSSISALHWIFSFSSDFLVSLFSLPSDFCWKGQNSSANKNPSIFLWPKKERCLSHLPKMRVFDLQLPFWWPNLFLVPVTQKSQLQ